MADVDIDTKPVYSIVSLLYKGMPAYIEYETAAGTILRYFFSARHASQGIFINPLFIDPALNLITIKRIRFVNTDPVFFNETIRLRWKTVSFKEEN